MKEKTTYTFGEKEEVEVSIDTQVRDKLEAQGVDVDGEIRNAISNAEKKLRVNENRDTREFLKE
jgi:post-segregation antitoxin (ccd killing protein)